MSKFIDTLLRWERRCPDWAYLLLIGLTVLSMVRIIVGAIAR